MMSYYYKEYKQLNLTETADRIRQYWADNDTFQKSLDNRDKDNAFVFFEGPPSANGTPGIHHVMARSIKDVVCRYQTLKGKFVVRKAGWTPTDCPSNSASRRNSASPRKTSARKSASMTTTAPAAKK